MTVTELEILESLDFDYKPPCEHSAHASDRPGHAGPAELVVRRDRPCCDGGTVTLLMCRPGFTAARRVRCGACGHIDSRDFFWTVIGEVE